MGAYFTCGPACAGYTGGGGSIIDILHAAVAAYNLGQQLQTGQVSTGSSARTEMFFGFVADIEEGLKRQNGTRTATMAHLFNAELNAQKVNARNGRPLTVDEKNIYKDHFPGNVLDSARIYDGKVRWYLGKGFDGITRGNRIYFREGVYQSGTAQGVEILGHELTDVQQYQNGMNAVDYLWNSRNGYDNNPYAVEAYKNDDIIKTDFCLSNPTAQGC